MRVAIYLRRNLALVLRLWCVGCSKKIEIDHSRVVGIYTGAIEGKAETLELKPEGTYVLQRDLGGHEQVIATGEWELVPYDDEIRIAAHGFPDRRSNANQGGTSVTLLGVERDRHGLRIYLSYDSNLYYSKVERVAKP